MKQWYKNIIFYYLTLFIFEKDIQCWCGQDHNIEILFNENLLNRKKKKR